MSLEKHAHPSLENYYNHTHLFAVTIQPDDKLQCLNRNYTVASRFLKFRSFYWDKLSTNIDDYYFVTELSEPRGNLHNHVGSRLHLHGYIWFESAYSLKRYLMKSLRLLLDNTRLTISKIETNESARNWWKYIHKQEILPDPAKIITSYTDSELFYNKKIKEYLSKEEG